MTENSVTPRSIAVSSETVSIKPRKLVLHVCREYYREIISGRKLEEFRKVKPYWTKRLIDREYDQLVIWSAYDKGTFSTFPYAGFQVKKIRHPHFGKKPVWVYAITILPDERPVQ